MDSGRTFSLGGLARFGACGAALALLLCGCVGYTSAGYGYYGEPGYVEVDPYIPAPDVYVFGGYGYPHRGYAHDFSHRGWESRREGERHEQPHVGGFRSTSRGSGRGGNRHR